MNNIRQILNNASEEITIENFNEMYNCLKILNSKAKQNKNIDELKELIQLIIDYLIYGDKKKEQAYFDCFCELDFMKQFIIASKNTNIEILLQIIKSMSALILTITNEASIFYIFSNNFINNIITNDDIQQSSEDFISFYINFLKSLSLKIDTKTIELFFHKGKNSFPLLENALKLYNHDDSMVKNVVRNIFLKFAGLSKSYYPLKEYLLSVPIIKYYCFLSCRLTTMTLRLDHLMGYTTLYKYSDQEIIFKYDDIKSLHDDLIDEILYFNDLLSLNDYYISSAVLNSLLYYYICPLLIGSIYNYKYVFNINQDPNLQRNLRFIISIEVSLYILSLLMSNIHNDSLLNILSYFLFKKKISNSVVNNFIAIHVREKYPVFPYNFRFNYNEQSEKDKHLTFSEYIAYNYDKKFICSLIMKPNDKYPEINSLHKKYVKFFEDSTFEPLENYEKIFKDVYNKLDATQKKYVRNYHNVLSVATGVRCGLSETEHQSNVINDLNKKINMINNPIRKYIFEELYKSKHELVIFQLNVLLYTSFYSIINAENIETNKSLSRKFLYKECNLLPYDLFINHQMININKNKEEEKKEEDNNNNIINTNDKKENIIEKEEEEEEEKEENEVNVKQIEAKPFTLNYENLLLFKTENYEIIYYDLNKAYSSDFIHDETAINGLIDTIEISHPYCCLELLLMIYNIRYLALQINNYKENNELACVLNDEQKKKLIKLTLTFIKRVKALLNNENIKTKMFQMLENSWNIYTGDYSFNQKNLIIKYILTPYYFCIPSTMVNIEDFPFDAKLQNLIYIIGFFALDDLNKSKNAVEFPIENGFFDYKIGDIIDISKIDTNNDKLCIIKALIRPEKRTKFEEGIFFLNKNSIIYGYQEEENKLKIKNILPIRELEICFEKKDSLIMYFKQENYYIKFESEDKAKEIKNALEQKRNSYIKWENEVAIQFWDEKEEEYNNLAAD